MAQEQEWQTLSGTVENIVYCNEENGYTVLEFSSGGDLYTAVVVLCPQEDAFTPPGAGMRGVAFATPDTLAQVVQAQLKVQE